MKIGVCQKDLPGTVRESLTWLSANGFEGFQIWKRHLDADGVSARELAAMAGDLGLEISAVGAGPSLVDPATASDAVDRFRTFLDLSVELGPCIVTTESKTKPPQVSDDDAWRTIVASVSRICEHAAGIGAVLAIECAGPCFISDHVDWHRLAERVGSDRLKVNLDPANIVWARRDAVEATRALAEHIVHTHAKDIVVPDARDAAAVGYHDANTPAEVRDVPAGEGLVGYDSYLAALRDTGYDGYLTIEIHAGGQDRRAEILQAATNLRRMLAGVQA